MRKRRSNDLRKRTNEREQGETVMRTRVRASVRENKGEREGGRQRELVRERKTVGVQVIYLTLPSLSLVVSPSLIVSLAHSAVFCTSPTLIPSLTDCLVVCSLSTRGIFRSHTRSLPPSLLSVANSLTRCLSLIHSRSQLTVVFCVSLALAHCLSVSYVVSLTRSLVLPLPRWLSFTRSAVLE